MTKTNVKTKRTVGYLFTFAAFWALLVGILIFLLPMGNSVTVELSSTGTPQITNRQVSFIEMNGWRGIFILMIFAALFYGPMHFYRRGNNLLALILATTAVLLSFIAGFSIGTFYWPGSISLLLGLALMLIPNPASKSSSK